MFPLGSHILSLTYVLALAENAAAGKAWGPWGGKPMFVSAGQSIQSAITSAQPGAKIIVKPGTYAEQLLITQSGLSLIGLPGATLVPPTTPSPNVCTNVGGTENDQAGICVAGKDVVFADAVAEHKKVSTVGQRVKDVTISGFTIKGFSGENIALVGAESTKVLGNTLIDGGRYGVLSDGCIDSLIYGNTVTKSPPLGFISICVDDVSGAKVQDNQVDGTYVGLCTQTSGADVSGNTVKNTCQAVFIDPDIAGAKVHDNHLSDSNPACNKAEDNPVGNYGVIAAGSIGAVIKDNTVERISSGGQTNPFAAGIAIIDWPAPPTLASDNVVEGNVLSENDFDVLLFTNGTGNVVQDNECSTSAPPGLC
ncbi:uncharacterized protein AB675_193 [Cyphellophora attinorum]|uniref:Right handed beta helix domain-containing protein n=1 Tax=Cyphellophora attinorum TaxID=1664694 RepID=A0A0N0NK72_9EURO|nr:uncharacterized protein AB675_193 [Phialophora attinorum]KPI37708.1 hypothetical protein AB675_193 [Phialophora attinorum]